MDSIVAKATKDIRFNSYKNMYTFLKPTINQHSIVYNFQL